ncbi:MAG: acyl--CoA ligase [candidate division KSB1 bacterium]|nr:acyl--CoA ligase [candidate division KSB1 bacterium]
MNTTDYLLQDALDNEVSIITPKQEYTYKDLKEATSKLASLFCALGLAPGERVGIWGNNSLFWIASYLATMKYGAIAVPLGSKMPVHVIAEQIEITNCKILCIEKRLQKQCANVFSPPLPLLNEDVLLENASVSWNTRTQENDENKDAVWMLTSGTTAKPRIVRITHLNIQANTDSIIQYLELSRADRMMAILPFYYCFGTSLLHTHLRVGGSLALGDTLGFPEKVLDFMEETACTGFAGVPTTFQMYLRNSTFPQRALPNLKKIQQAGGKLPNVLIEELIQCRPTSQIYIMYGQTEATARLSYLPPLLLSKKLGSIGRGIPGVILKVLNDEGKEVKPGEHGEIVAYGKNISPGYLDEPEANAEKFVNGWLHTGDIATVDEEGYIYILDRKSDFIKSYGHRVSSQEIEACILEIKDVVAAAVVGTPDPLHGEAIRAFVVLRANARVNESVILHHCMKKLARYKVPREILFVQSLPLNQHGKVIKSELKKLEVSP